MDLLVAIGQDDLAVGDASAPFGLPWDIPEDRARFASATRGKTLIMGRKTADTLVGLPSFASGARPFWVLSRRPLSPSYPPWARGFASVEAAAAAAAAAAAEASACLVVVGGADVAEQFLRLGLIRRASVTWVSAQAPHATARWSDRSWFGTSSVASSVPGRLQVSRTGVSFHVDEYIFPGHISRTSFPDIFPGHF